MFFLNQELAATTHPLDDFFCLFSEAKPTIAKKKKKKTKTSFLGKSWLELDPCVFCQVWRSANLSNPLPGSALLTSASEMPWILSLVPRPLLSFAPTHLFKNKLTSLSSYHLHTLEFTCLKCTMQWLHMCTLQTTTLRLANASPHILVILCVWRELFSLSNFQIYNTQY